MLKMKKVSDCYDLEVYTDNGDYFGNIEDSIMEGNKVARWQIKITKNSFLTKILGTPKGVIVPHQLVKAIGDIMIVSRDAVPGEGSSGSED